MQPTGELNQRGRVQRLKEGAVHASEVDRGVLAHRLHSESDRRPRRYPDHPLWVTSPQFGQGEVNGYSPGLWTSIEKALDASEYFILLASPQAAESQWVDKE